METQCRQAEVVVSTLPENDFYQAMSLLKRDGSLGGNVHYCFKAQPLMYYPCRLLEGTVLENNCVSIDLTFFDWFGPSSLLPELMSEHDHRIDGAIDCWQMVIDHFAHLLYQVWQCHHVVAVDETTHEKFLHHDAIQLLLALLGRKNTDGLFHSLWIQHANYLLWHARSVEGLQVMLSHYLHLPVRIDACQKRWIALEENQRTLLSGVNSQLAQGASVGRRVCFLDQVINIIIGPFVYREYQRLHRNKVLIKHLRQIVNEYLGGTLDFQVTVSITPDSIPKNSLSNIRGANELGWNIWLGSSVDISCMTDKIVRLKSEDNLTVQVGQAEDYHPATQKAIEI